MPAFFTVHRVIAIIVMAAAVVLFMVGCSNQAAQLQPQIVAADAAVVSGHTLFTNGGISQATAKKLSVDAHLADAGFKAALASINSGQSPAETTVSQILASLGTLSEDLQSTPEAKAKGVAIKNKLAAYKGKKTLTPDEVITLIDLAVQLTPGVIQEVDLLFSGSTITPADCQTSLTKFETDLAALDAAVQ